MTKFKHEHSFDFATWRCFYCGLREDTVFFLDNISEAEMNKAGWYRQKVAPSLEELWDNKDAEKIWEHPDSGYMKRLNELQELRTTGCYIAPDTHIDRELAKSMPERQFGLAECMNCGAMFRGFEMSEEGLTCECGHKLKIHEFDSNKPWPLRSTLRRMTSPPQLLTDGYALIATKDIVLEINTIPKGALVRVHSIHLDSSEVILYMDNNHGAVLPIAFVLENFKAYEPIIAEAQPIIPRACDMIENDIVFAHSHAAPLSSTCDCGAEKTGTGHSHWCSFLKVLDK